jgi:hypothetical protein
MSKTLKKFKKQYDSDDRHHDAKRRKTAFKNKQIRSLDNILKTKDVKKILNYE